MAEYMRDVPHQKIKAGEKHICPECFHYRVCMGRVNRPCFECDCFVPAVNVREIKDTPAERLCKTCEAECCYKGMDTGPTYTCTVKANMPYTNASRIRAMNDEELARQIAEFTGYRGNPEEVAFWLNWLKSPAEDAT